MTQVAYFGPFKNGDLVRYKSDPRDTFKVSRPTADGRGNGRWKYTVTLMPCGRSGVPVELLELVPEEPNVNTETSSD